MLLLLHRFWGVALMESGAAEKIVSQLMRVFGESRAGIALILAGFYPIPFPVFFLIRFFFLLVPLAIALATKTGKNFLLYVMAISCGAIITHSLVPPTPGPLVMAETLDFNLGLVIVVGLLSGLLPAIAGYKFIKKTKSNYAHFASRFDGWQWAY